MAAATQAFDNDGFPPLTGIDGTSSASSKRADNRTTKRVAFVVNFAQNSPRTSSQRGCRKSFLIKLALVACQRLASRKVRLEGCRRQTVQDGLIICTTIRASRDGKNSGNDDEMFHGLGPFHQVSPHWSVGDGKRIGRAQSLPRPDRLVRTFEQAGSNLPRVNTLKSSYLNIGGQCVQPAQPDA